MLLWDTTGEALSARVCAGDGSLSASIKVRPIPENIKVPTFMFGLRHGPSRQALFRMVPSTLKTAIQIALVEEQSFNSASAKAKYKL